MATYIISYDLPEGSNYDNLIDRIKEYGTWAHITLSTWAVVTEDTASIIRDTLKSYIPEGGRLFVVKSANVAAWNNTMCTNDWLQNYL